MFNFFRFLKVNFTIYFHSVVVLEKMMFEVFFPALGASALCPQCSCFDVSAGGGEIIDSNSLRCECEHQLVLA